MTAGNFLQENLARITVALRDTLQDEDLARRPGLLQRLDARAKAIGTLALLLAAGLSRRWEPLLVLHCSVLLLAWASRLPLGPFLRRVWVFVPAFTALVALPALFLTPGEPLLWILREPVQIAVTRQGAFGAGTLVLRVGASVSLAVLLLLTTPWPALLHGFRGLGVPQALVLLLHMARRYIFLFLENAEALLLGRRSRSIGRLPPAVGRRMAAGMAGTLLARSYHLSQEVQLAMEARGFRGEVRLAELPRFRLRDGLALAVALAAGVWIVWVGR
ncbi:MAG: cobalt ECF transporter T component CbiQ [Chloroflexia bacterium]